ncbi:Predicted pyrophosphatase or phosphodiesterase, AlkP superfamily [Pedobacter westerhofensis]|uniref:Predicted pyrophosphatase or phosphodiesterase, AlkP superfamily n=1 Tax=Pedobacter westerhofensis TaxID=425512 RepID=A0A521EHQ8_9SPHI|nr:ectonucleotide pyrophosphatase/phosphodiesterase [Pedobacter westerhofensis]SMO83001.1 Predicted pyrophosphatase or phosphodiesterase, AlkP superfamily [Pedobacter westerhofensis]
MKKVLTFLALSFCISSLSAQTDTVSHIIAGRSNTAEQQKKPYVILISADGFRYDYAKKYHADHLLELSSEGVRAKAMIPSFPSVTFPNHYTLVTGMYPSHHGLVGNSFYSAERNDQYSMSNKRKVTDGKWYGGTPLWVLAEQQHMLAASLFWVGSEAVIKGIRPTYYYNYTEKISMPQRIEIVLNWLKLPEETRPHFITFYLSEPDHSGHHSGPETPQTAAAVRMVDSVVYQLTQAVKTTGLPVSFVFVSDHGMTQVDTAHPIPMPKIIDADKFRTTFSSTTLALYARDKADIAPMYNALRKSAKDYKVYLKTEMPERLHYGAEDDRMNRIGDIILIPQWPRVFSDKTPGMGHHGFDPRKVKDMQATFFAWGPAFREHVKIPAFENVNVYPLITNILGLSYTEEIDGKKEILEGILKK